MTRIGYRAGAAPSEVVLPERSPNHAGNPNPKDVQLVVHELGHVLGLRPRREHCKVMNPKLAGDCDPILSGGEWLCGPLQRDLEKAARVYGVRPAAVDPYCLS